MVKIFEHTLTILSRRQNSILSAASVIMVAVALSRLLGLMRDWLLITRFTPKLLGVYIAAFRVPNMIFELLVIGALSSAFIPVFTHYLDTKGDKEAFRVASSVINIGLIMFMFLSIPMLLFTKEISRFLAPGFSKDEIELMSSFSRIMIIAQVFPFIIGAFFTGVLQSYRNFLVPAIAPIVYNFGIIIGIILLSPFFGLYGPVIGVVLGAVMFTLIQAPLVISLGYRHSMNFDYHHPGTKEIGKLMLPRTVGLAVSQIDVTIDLILSSLLGTAAVTIFNFAQHLQQVPIGLFGASIAQATFPSLSSFHAQKNLAEFKKVFISSFNQILFLIVPLSAILIVLRLPIVRLAFGIRSLLDMSSTLETSKTLAYFSISLFAQALVHLTARSFYALHDTKTPVIVGALSVVINTIVSILFVIYYHWGVWSLGLSTSIASIVNMLLLLHFLDRRVGYFDRYELLMPVFKIFLSGLVTGVALYLPIKLLDQLVFDTTKTLDLIKLTGTSTILGMSVYLFLTWFLEVPQISILAKIFSKAKALRRGVVIDTTQEISNVQEVKI